MKGPQSLEDGTAVLVEQLTSGLNDCHGIGSMSAAVCDTAWLVTLSKPIECTGT